VNLKFTKILALLIFIGAGNPVFAYRGELPDFASLVKQNAAAVVNISTTQVLKQHKTPREFNIPDLPEDSPFRDFFRRYFDEIPEERNARSLGSGFVISEDGYIMTSAHVIADATEILVRFSDRRELEAKVIGSDTRSDVALLKVEAKGLPVVRIGNPQRLSVGEWVLAIGSPFGFESTATAGIVSAKGRSLPNESYVPFIQTDVAINPGNSGGPLFNLDGEVVGINAQIYSRTGGFMGLSFAVPIDIATEVTDQLKRSGKVSRGWLGVLIQDVTSELAESFGMEKPTGALVSEILPNSPAAVSNLKPGDIILRYNDSELSRMSDLPPLVGFTPIGETVKLEVIRGGKARIVEVTIGELSEEEQQLAEQAGEQEADDRLLGMMVKDLSREQKKKMDLEGGVYVADVASGPASRAGIQTGDVIVQIQDKAVMDIDTFKEIVSELTPGKSVPILIRRENRSMFLALKTNGDTDHKD
jgi:serine protease Do